ncbi:MAG: hypothetical protein GXO09_04225 [Crenarchaeota archaeon]|nr:hypothetical protein [Thermoproteota archaeon]
MSERRASLIKILRAVLEAKLASPSDVVVRTGLPRYEVLAAFHVLEALGVVKEVYSKGNHRLYVAQPVAAQLLHVLESGAENPLEELARELVPIASPASSSEQAAAAAPA